MSQDSSNDETQVIPAVDDTAEIPLLEQAAQYRYPAGTPAPGAAVAPAAPPVAQPQHNRKAIIAAVLAGLGLFFGLLCSIPAIVMGHKALRAAKANGGNGRGLALIATTAGYVLTVPGLLIVVGAGARFAQAYWMLLTA